MTRTRHGFTIIETLIGLVLAVMVLGGLLAFLVSGSAIFKRSQERLDPRESVHTAMSQLGLKLMDAWSYEVASGGATLAFRSVRGSSEVAFSAEAGRVVLREGTRTTVLIPSGVKAFRMRELFAGMVRIELELRRAPGGLGDCRIVHEIRIAAVGERDPFLPIRPVFALDAPPPV